MLERLRKGKEAEGTHAHHGQHVPQPSMRGSDSGEPDPLNLAGLGAKTPREGSAQQRGGLARRRSRLAHAPQEAHLEASESFAAAPRCG